jgi:hypothetical protein
MEHYTNSCEPTLLITLVMSEYVRLHRAMAHYRNFYQRNALSAEDFSVLQEITELQDDLNSQVTTQLNAQLTEWNNA